MTNFRLIVVVIVLACLFTASGWRTVSDAQRDEDTKWQLKQMDRDAMKLEDRVNDLDKRVKALEAKP